MFEKYVYLTLIKGGQEKENHSQQIPTFRCSEWANFKDLHCKDLLLSPHRGYVPTIYLNMLLTLVDGNRPRRPLQCLSTILVN